MSGHSQACEQSRALCDELYLELRRLIPELQRNSTKGSCGLWRNGYTRFAYVYHSKTKVQVEVWCRGDRDQLLRSDPGLGVRGRDQTRSGWEESFPARFRIHRREQIAESAQFLAAVSLRASTPKGK